MNIEHTPEGDYTTCPMFGMKRTALAVSTSNHPVLDIVALATAKQKPQYSFQTSLAVCPACQGSHRQHTYSGDCKKAKTGAKAKPKAEPQKKVAKKHAERDAKSKPKVLMC